VHSAIVAARVGRAEKRMRGFSIGRLKRIDFGREIFQQVS
jgi:hypothetical protein